MVVGYKKNVECIQYCPQSAIRLKTQGLSEKVANAAAKSMMAKLPAWEN